MFLYLLFYVSIHLYFILFIYFQIVIQIGEEVDGMVMIRSGDNRQGVCPVKYLTEVWQTRSVCRAASLMSPTRWFDKYIPEINNNLYCPYNNNYQQYQQQQQLQQLQQQQQQSQQFLLQTTKTDFLAGARNFRIAIPSSFRPLGMPTSTRMEATVAPMISPMIVGGCAGRVVRRPRSMRNFTSLSRPLLIG